MAGFFLRTALNHLRRGEQRVWAALACITFGVMSLVAMMTISESLTHSLLLSPREQIGGDVNAGRQVEDVVSPEAEAGLQGLQAEGVITQYVLAARAVLSAPANVGLPTVLAAAGDIVISRDLAETFGIAVGDALILSDLAVGQPLTGIVRGIASDTPNHEGGRIFYTVATAEAL